MLYWQENSNFFEFFSQYDKINTLFSNKNFRISFFLYTCAPALDKAPTFIV